MWVWHQNLFSVFRSSPVLCEAITEVLRASLRNQLWSSACSHLLLKGGTHGLRWDVKPYLVSTSNSGLSHQHLQQPAVSIWWKMCWGMDECSHWGDPNWRSGLLCLSYLSMGNSRFSHPCMAGCTYWNSLFYRKVSEHCLLHYCLWNGVKGFPIKVWLAQDWVE